jgi:two-component system, NarL family, sensor histidine kinase UhpB
MQKQLPTILIVDDTDENLLFLETIIGKLEVNLIKATNGPEALEKIKDVELALAILDVWMPEMTGYELAEWINFDRIENRVPVMFLTANFFSEVEMLKGYSFGAVDYIFKPVDRKILLSKINVFIDLYNQKQTIAYNARLLKDYSDKLTIVNSALKKSEEKYRNYIDSAPDGVFVTDETGKYIEVNQAACRITGYSKEELLELGMSDLLKGKSVEEVKAFFIHLEKGGTYNLESTFRHKSGAIKWMQIVAVHLSKLQFLCFVKDITDTKLVNEALKESEDRFRSFFELTADLMVIADINGYFKDVNSSWTNVLGYSKEDLLGKPYLEYIHPEDLDFTKKFIEEKLGRGDTVLFFENRYLKKDGEFLWLEWTSQPNLLKGCIYAIARDITERKQAESELKNSLEQLHQLTQHIEKVREEERVAISRELHDDLGQALTAVNIDMRLIKQNITNPDAISRINKVSALVGETIKTVQRLTSRLRPQIIDDLGLDAAIEWHTKEFSQRFGVKINLDLDRNIVISPDASLTVFRIMQESLTNIARHSKASLVDIKFARADGKIHFRISDNGIGITENEIKSKKSFGLIGMKERAASLGGKIEISYQKDVGTAILLTFPFKSEWEL